MYSSNNLSNTVNDWATVINIKLIEIHWIAQCANGKNVTCFDNVGAGSITKEMKKLLKIKVA